MTYEDFLVEEMAKRPELLVLTAENRAVIRGLPERAPERFVDFGIAEMTMVGAAAGMALRGRVPVAHALATFLVMRAYEFVRTDVGIPSLPVKLSGFVPGFLSVANGPTHQAIEDIALMRGIPGMHVFCPANREELLAGMRHVLDNGAPTYIRYTDGPATYEVPEFEYGKAATLREGRDVALLTYGFLTQHVLNAAEELAKEGIEARVVNMRTLEPVDTGAIVAAARECKAVFTIEDHFQRGGLYTIVAETLVERQQTARVVPFALDRKWFVPALLDDVLEHEGFSGPKLAARVRRAI